MARGVTQLQTTQHPRRSSHHVVDRFLDVLDAFEAEPELGVTELARRLGIDKSTASRQLAALASRHYVDRDPVTGRFRLGIRLLRLGTVVRGRLDIRTAALGIMSRLRDDTDETVSLVIRRDARRTCVEVMESQQLVRRTHPVGVFREMFPGALGKLFLAYMPPEEAGPIIESVRCVRLASGVFADPRQLAAELPVIRADGVAWAQGERNAGAATAAFPVFDHTGSVVAALGISMPLARLTPEVRHRCVELGRAAAGELSNALGYCPVEQPSTGS